MKFVCKKDLYLDKYDDDGFLIENKKTHIPKDSIWEEDSDSCKLIGGPDSVRLNRIWKTKTAKTYQWIEITKKTLSMYFTPLTEGKKAALIIDMPNSCRECIFFRDIDDEKACCEATENPDNKNLCRRIDVTFSCEKPSWCPLKEVSDNDCTPIHPIKRNGLPLLIHSEN